MLKEKSHAAICCITAARRGKFTQTRAEREGVYGARAVLQV
jgi:hypothetical protein